jgi:BirA family transcriptional regulator, biotin operon repressor / biotin---[acetyl-CoA-carboxylase] ligase
MLTLERLQITLAPRPFQFYQRVDSTNDIALEWLRSNAPAGAVVIADEQIKGRGRLGRTWHNSPGTALVVSIILRPQARHLSRLSMLGALAVCETIESLGISEVGIKWPNDVQLQGRKVCGILPEAVWEGDQLQGAILGIGVNVRVDFTGTELAETAISLETVLKKQVDRLDLLGHLLKRVDDWSLHMDAVFDAWKTRLTTLGQQVKAGDVEGTAESVDDDGALLIRNREGNLNRVIAGDIALGR